MKTITLLAASILLATQVTKATETTSFKTVDATTTRFSFDEPISFNERGIEFFVFPNGDFDFNTRPQDSHGDYYYKSAGKKGASDVRRNNGPVNYGVLVEFDSFGRVRRVGNTFVNYDTRDRVSRVGTVFMRYNRFALEQIGGMRLLYNRFGEITDMIGSVKGRTQTGFTYNYYGSNNHHDNDDDTNYQASNYNSNSYYYYKADGTKAKIEDDKK